MIFYAILVVMTFIGAIASLFLKRASNSTSFLRMLGNYNLYIGGILYLTSALLNIYVLQILPYSVVLPLTAVTYIWTMALSRAFLNEIITPKKIVGVILIIIGAIGVAI